MGWGGEAPCVIYFFTRPFQSFRCVPMQRIDPLDVSDIDGAVARQPARRNTSHHPFNSNADIAATTPQPRRLPTSRLTNPLEPDYSLPTFVPAPETESSKPAREVLFTLEQPPRRVSATRDLMDWSDVTQAESRHGRKIEPMTPTSPELGESPPTQVTRAAAPSDGNAQPDGGGRYQRKARTWHRRPAGALLRSSRP